jgi:hypothetical protein
MAIANITNNILVDSNIDVNSLELLSNKSTSTSLGTSNTLYPTQNAVKVYVDNQKDVLEFANLAAFPVTGETSKIYVDLDTNFTYRWSGSVYVKLNTSEFIIPKYYIHNWTQAGQNFFDPLSPEISNLNIRMEAPGLGNSFYITAVFSEPVLISKIFYACGNVGNYTSSTNIRDFQLLASTLPTLNAANTGVFPIILHNTSLPQHAQMQQNTSIEDFFNLKEINLGNPQIVRSISFFATTVWAGTRPTIVKLLFK